jgi:hypothetical protein
VAAGKPIPDRDLDGKALRAMSRGFGKLRTKTLDGRRPASTQKTIAAMSQAGLPAASEPEPEPESEPRPEPLGPDADLPAIPEWRKDPMLVEDKTKQQEPEAGADDTTIVVDPTNL